ncbi:cyclase family protein, partial [Corynebacterium variabile]|uniref:cyclase family protein n=2 Tax=Corynebacterium TaxID=1716 RepID=UPI003F9C5B99
MDGTGSACFADLTHALTTGMPVYPGDPEVEIDEVLTLPADGCSVRSLHLGSHSGTHVDAPAHVIAGGRTIDQVAPEELMGDAAVLHLPDLTTRQRIDGEMLGEA